MQTIGGVGAMFSVVVGLLGSGRENQALLRPALAVGGIAFVLLAFLGYRLGKRQDDCELVMREIEASLRSMGYPTVATVPAAGQAFGARKAIVTFLVLLGVSLVFFALRGW